MKTKYFLTTFSLLLVIAVKAQFAPVGSKWYYGYGVGNGQPGIEGVYTYTCEADTIINSDTYSKVIYQSHYDSSSGTFFITKDTANVYYWKDDSRKLLFKTNCNVGDTILIDLYFYRKIGNPTPVNIDTAVSSEVVIKEIRYLKTNSLDNDSLKQFLFEILNYLNNPIPAPYGYYTEKVINIGGDHNWQLLSLIDEASIPEGTDYLRCYNSSTYNYRNKYIPANWACDFYNVGLNNLDKENEIAVYPNPVKGFIAIIFKNKNLLNTSNELFIYDETGKELFYQKLKENQSSIKIENTLNYKGIAFVALRNVNGIFYKKIILQ